MRNDLLTTTIIQKVHAIYTWLDRELSRDRNRVLCRRCGQCCNFQAYDHRLFVTTPEMIYFQAACPEPSIRPITKGRCPFNENGLCTVHAIRFTGCRIFSCQGSPDKQAQLSEQALTKFKHLCEHYHLDYRYMDLATALQTLVKP